MKKKPKYKVGEHAVVTTKDDDRSWVEVHQILKVINEENEQEVSYETAIGIYPESRIEGVVSV